MPGGANGKRSTPSTRRRDRRTPRLRPPPSGAPARRPRVDCGSWSLPIIGTPAPLRRYGTSAPLVYARSPPARRRPPQPRAGAHRGPGGVRGVGLRRAARRDRGAGRGRAGHGLPALPDEGGAVRGGHAGAGAGPRRRRRGGRRVRRPRGGARRVPRAARRRGGRPSATCPTRSAGSGRRPSRWPGPSSTRRSTRCSPARGRRAPCAPGSARPNCSPCSKACCRRCRRAPTPTCPPGCSPWCATASARRPTGAAALTARRSRWRPVRDGSPGRSGGARLRRDRVARRIATPAAALRSRRSALAAHAQEDLVPRRHHGLALAAALRRRGACGRLGFGLRGERAASGWVRGRRRVVDRGAWPPRARSRCSRGSRRRTGGCSAGASAGSGPRASGPRPEAVRPASGRRLRRGRRRARPGCGGRVPSGGGGSPVSTPALRRVAEPGGVVVARSRCRAGQPASRWRARRPDRSGSRAALAGLRAGACRAPRRLGAARLRSGARPVRHVPARGDVRRRGAQLVPLLGRGRRLLVRPRDVDHRADRAQRACGQPLDQVVGVLVDRGDGAAVRPRLERPERPVVRAARPPRERDDPPAVVALPRVPFGGEELLPAQAEGVRDDVGQHPAVGPVRAHRVRPLGDLGRARPLQQHRVGEPFDLLGRHSPPRRRPAPRTLRRGCGPGSHVGATGSPTRSRSGRAG